LVRQSAKEVPSLLLLSATPALADTHGFLRLLHLLDPVVFPLEDLEGFERRIESRQVVAELVAKLVPENLLVLEDDLEIGDDFVDFMKSGIKEILNYENALLVSANQFYSGTSSNKNWTTYPLIWGWSTTALKWEVMKKLITQKKVDRSVERKWHVRGFWASGRMREKSGILDSWALPLADSFHHGKYLAYCPPENLCRNIGDDQFAVHTNTTTPWMSMPIGRFEKSNLKIYPNQNSIDLLDDFLEKNVFGVKYRNVLSPLQSLILIYFQNIRFTLSKKGKNKL
jgi:hypothetical protein